MPKTEKFGFKSRAALVALVVVTAGLWGTYDHWGPLIANATTEAKTEKEAADDRPQQKGVPVIVEAAGERENSLELTAIGTARAVRSVSLYPDDDGEIVAFPVASGGAVNTDDIIMRLDSRDERLAVSVAKTRVDEAERQVDRAERLRANNVRSTANVEDAEIIMQRARLELRQANEALANRTMRAPFEGLVGIPKVEVGDRVDTGTEIITLDDRSSLLVEFEVAERYLGRIDDGMAIAATTPTFPDRTVDGRIERIDSRVDPISRTVLVRAVFTNTEDILRPGMSFFVKLSLPGETLPVVPELALQWSDGESYVWRISDGVAERVVVEPRRRQASSVLVAGGIRPGDLVVVEGVQRLRDGRQVDIAAMGN